MSARLCLNQGVLYVASAERSGRVVPFDLEGRRLEGGFRVPASGAGACRIAGLFVDDDRRVWLADKSQRALRGFTLFGHESQRLGNPRSPSPWRSEPDVAGNLGLPSALAGRGSSDDLWLVLGSQGPRRHGAQVFDGAGRLVRSLRPLGDSHGRFQGVRGIELLGRSLLLFESQRPRVQVFRDLEHWFSFEVELPRTREAELVAVRALAEGRFVALVGGEEPALLEVDGRGKLLRVLAVAGEDTGRLSAPADLVVDRERQRLALLDREGLRIQVFTIDGECAGAFACDAI
jgi:hypothetical protein